MYCTNCGAEVINSKFCTSCGEKIQNNKSELEHIANVNNDPLEKKEIIVLKEFHETNERIQHLEEGKNQVNHTIKKDRELADNRFILVAIMLPVIILIISVVSIFTPLTSSQVISIANRIYNLAVILCLLDYLKLQKLGYKSKTLMILLLLSMVPQIAWLFLPIIFFVRAKILNQKNHSVILGVAINLVVILSMYGITFLP